MIIPAPSRARAGEWLLATRPGAEQDLIEELAYRKEAFLAARPVAPGLVAAEAPRRAPRIDAAFARQGFLVSRVVTSESADSGEALAALGQEVGGAVLEALRALSRSPVSWAFDAWVADSDESNPLSSRVAQLQLRALETVRARAPEWAARLVPSARAALSDNGLYAQACLLVPGRACAVGAQFARDAPILAPGGRLRVRAPEGAPSRAAMKLLEAFAWLDRAPEPGDVCVDLGAAPGGWTWVLLERRAKVYAVDPARLAPSLRGKKGLEHIPADAFKFDPGDPVDWLLGDMAWRPLEAAALLAKWARRRWARFLIANIKLPMKKKAEYLARVKEILEDGGWSDLRARQLYHDRDEVTLAAVRV